ncbi:polysaccharide deacteylase family 2 protein [Shimia ponticola]|uniref:polysaccharide deacteylase family 2 protein n=1 Tax=Shimia ponticola TaxID=2582893 RepID=UPI0011BF02D9|nr:polysaccharide deacteylase family 2 protein [Shimia ponticola]
MGRGLIFGAFWGFVVGGAVLSVASLLGETPGATPPRADVIEVPAGSAFDTAKEDEPAQVAAEPEEAPDTGTAPMVDAPAAPPAPTLGSDVTASADVPVTGDVQELAPPPATPQDSGVTVQLEAPATPEVSTEEATSLPTAEPQAAPEVSPETTPSSDVSQEQASQTPVPSDTPSGDKDQAQESDATDTSVQEDDAEPVVTAEPEPEATTEDTAETDADPLDDAPRPQASAGGFGDRATNVTTNRLPSIGDTAETNPVARAIDTNAVTDRWGGLDDRPLVSIILIDENADAAALPALQGFEGPLTFALPAGRADALQAMQAYRAAGHEVALIADLPAGAAPADVETAFQTYLQSVPAAATVLDGSLNGFGGDRRVVAQVADILAETGHGLVTFEQGLNSTAQTARRAGVPTGTVFRDLDSSGQDARVITRFLDQAAFRAGQEGQVILLARLRADTISALLIWSQQDRAQRVNLAPASAVLLETEAQ